MRLAIAGRTGPRMTGTDGATMPLVDLTEIPLTEVSLLASPVLAACLERLLAETAAEGPGPAARFDSAV